MAEPALTMLQAIAREVLQAPSLVLSEPLPTADVPGWTSLSSVDIVLALEERLGVEFDAAELGRLTTVGDYLRLVRTHQGSSETV